MTTQPFTPSRSADFLIKVAGLGTMATLDAISISGQSTAVYDGGALTPYILGGRAAPTEFTMSRPFSRKRDMDLYRKYLDKVNQVYLNVMIYPTDAELQTDGPHFQGLALLTEMQIPAIDANREGAPNPAMFTIKMRAPKWTVA